MSFILDLTYKIKAFTKITLTGDDDATKITF